MRPGECIEGLIHRLDRRLTVIGRLLYLEACRPDGSTDPDEYMAGLEELVEDTNEQLVQPLLSAPVEVLGWSPDEPEDDETDDPTGSALSRNRRGKGGVGNDVD